MEHIKLSPTEGPDVEFVGERIATEFTVGDSGHHNFSGSTGRGTYLHLYRTESGKLVLDEGDTTQWIGEHDTNEVHVFDTEQALIDYLGTRRMAKALYDEAGIKVVKRID